MDENETTATESNQRARIGERVGEMLRTSHKLSGAGAFSNQAAALPGNGSAGKGCLL